LCELEIALGGWCEFGVLAGVTDEVGVALPYLS
jgi:hypothetical protein